MRPLSACIIRLLIVNIGVGPEDHNQITGKGHYRSKRPPPINCSSACLSPVSSASSGGYPYQQVRLIYDGVLGNNR